MSNKAPLIEIQQCSCCDNHILYLDTSVLRGTHKQNGEPIEEGLIPMADLTPEQCVLLGDKCHQAIRDWVKEI